MTIGDDGIATRDGLTGKPRCDECGAYDYKRHGHLAECSQFLIDASEPDDDEPPAPRAGERKRSTNTSIPLATEQNEWQVVKTIPERLTSDVILRVSDDDGIRLPWHRQELLEVIARYANGYPKAAKALNDYKKQHATLVEQRDRLLAAAQFALTTPGLIRGRDSLQKIVDDLLTTIEQGVKNAEEEGR